MIHTFSPAFFTHNRQTLLDAVGPDSGPVILTANGMLQRGGDSPYRFEQDANFWYLTGIDEPDIILVLDAHETYLIVPSRTASRIAFDGMVDADELFRISGISVIRDETEGWQQLTALLKKTNRYASTRPPEPYIDAAGFYTNPAKQTLSHRLHQIVPSEQMQDITLHLVRARMNKQPDELFAIETAIDITLKTFVEVTDVGQFHAYQHEYEIEAAITRGFRSRGAEGHAFDPIVASGARACTLHNFRNDAVLEEGTLVVMDVGAEVSHYAADITRTVAYGAYTARQAAVHAAVFAVQEQAIAILRPGVLLKDYEQQVEQLIGEQLLALGLIREITHDAVRHYYPHATSHFVGLNVHDAGIYQEPLAAGSVLTVEPGIYIPEEGIGIRIEDMVHLTTSGNRLLSGGFAKNLDGKV